VSDGDGTLRGAMDEMVLLLAPLVGAAEEPDAFARLLAELGWTVASVPTPLLELATAGSTLIDVLWSEPDDVSAQQVLDAIGAVAAAVEDIHAAPDSAFPSSVDVASFKQTIGRDLLDYCVVEYLLHDRFKLGRVLKLVGVVQLIDTPASGLRGEYFRRYVNWSEIGALLTDPLNGFREAYGWRTATPQLSDAAADVGAVLEAFGLYLSFFALTPGQLAFANAGSTSPLPGQVGLELDLGEALGVPPEGSAGVQFFVRPGTAERGPAVAIVPFADLTGSAQPASDDDVSLTISGDADLTQGFAITLAPGHDPTVDGGFLGGGAPTTPTRLQVAMKVPPVPDAPERIIVGTADASRLSLHTLTVTAGAALLSNEQLEAFVDLRLDKLRVVVKPSADDTDSFIADLLGPDGFSAELTSGLRVSSITGFHLTGSAGLEGRFSVDVQIGPVDVQAISIALKPATQGVDFEVGASVAGVLGPFTVVVDRVGFALNARFPDPPTGNLGPLDLAFGFLPPTGIGLSVEADVLTGGGFIGYDPDTGRYSGLLELQAKEIGITGVGILDTRLPSGASGYALLIALEATFPAIQIGFGFALTGVGGLLALNRRVDVDVLRSRLAAGTAGRILAPQDPIRNAPALLADLDAVFPIAPGVTVVGPTAQLVWAGLVHLDIGVFIELPGPSRVVLLGSAYAEIASDGRTYLSIRVDIVGVVDLRAETAAFDAALVDSHLLGMLDLTGGAAFRLSWGAQPYAVLTLGGFNPSYNPEPLSFPASLTRIAMVHGKPSDEVYLRFEGYFAITSNTLQLGASVEAAINSGGWAIHGSIGFDALIQRVPYHFEFDIRASVSVAYSGHTLASLTLTGSLNGPGPVVLRARVCIELLFFDVCFSHTFELGPTTPPPVPIAPDLLDALVTELTNPARVHAGGGGDPFVRLLPTDTSLTMPLVVPTGTVVWEQQLAPLGLLLTRIGGTPLPSPAQVTATTTAASATVSDWFAPGLFLDLTDDEALTQPGYELLGGGLRLAGTGTTDGPAAQTTLTTLQIRLPAAASTTKPVFGLPAWLLTTAVPIAAPAITVTTETWTVATPAGDRTGLTGAQARRLAALAGDAVAVPATDNLAAIAF
jgi:uncharacterized protein DUF6603